MENIVYNELLVRGYNVDVGIVFSTLLSVHSDDDAIKYA